jgi:radical SAM-linked protein
MASIEIAGLSGDELVMERVEEIETTNDDSTTNPVKVKGPAVQPRFRYRIIFEKKGPLRFISHNDLMRTWDRLLRRTALPLRLTEGFHAKLKVSSPLSLAVGIEATEEIFDFELTHHVPESDVESLVRRESIPGLNIVSVTELSPTAASRVTAVEYTCLFQEGLNESEVSRRIEEILSGSSLMIERRVVGKPLRRIDIRPKIDSIAAAGNKLHMRLLVDDGSTVRPEEVLGALELGQQVRDGVVVITRTKLELGHRK